MKGFKGEVGTYVWVEYNKQEFITYECFSPIGANGSCGSVGIVGRKGPPGFRGDSGDKGQKGTVGEEGLLYQTDFFP